MSGLNRKAEASMRAHQDNDVGRFTVEIDLANYGDVVAAERGFLDSSKISRLKLQGLVDSDATRLVLPQKAVKELGLSATGKVKVRYADVSTSKKSQVEGVYVELLGRHGTFSATVEPKRETALIGAIVLEDLDFLVDCIKGRLVPRDPDFVVNEIE